MSTPNYGLDADLKKKQAEKYDHALEAEVTKWIEAVSGQSRGGQDFGEWLKNGQVLCELCNKINPGTVKKINTQSMPFKQMENITYFMNAAREWGVPENAMFGTPDLYEGKNLGSVVNCINVLGGVVQVKFPAVGPKLGIAQSVESKDKARGGRVITDQSAGFNKNLEVERPQDNKLIRGTAEITKSPGNSPRPAGETSSPRPAATGSPRPAAGGAGYSAASAPAPANASGQAPTSGNEHNFGLDAECKAKQAAKYDVGLEGEVTKWIEAITGESRGGASMHEWLKDGKVLCNLANKVKPGSIAKINTMNAPFKQMENITYFMNHARAMGVPESAMFGTPDLYEDKNMGSVVTSLYTYGGAIQTSCPSFTGPKLGVAMVESKDAKRTGGLCTDASAGFSAKCEVERPVQAMKR